jgi:hypothetical protein
MSKEFLIQNARFRTRIAPGEAVTWKSDQHTLLYPQPGLPPGSDRTPQFTVNAYMRMVFNKPNTGLLQVNGGAVAGYAGLGAVLGTPSSMNLLPGPGTFVFGASVYSGPPAPIFGSSFRTINFIQSSLPANLGQSIFYEVSFYNGNPDSGPGSGPIEIDVTFTGALVSSEHRLDASS